MTCKEICECIYKSFCNFSENIALVVEFVLQVLKWLFLVITAPLWLIPYTINKKQKEEKKKQHYDYYPADFPVHPMCRCSLEPVFESEGDEDVP